MIAWRSFGASVIGPGHAASRLPNQDAWLAFHHIRADGIVVSDGLGSKPLSDFGSSEYNSHRGHYTIEDAKIQNCWPWCKLKV